MSHIILKGDLFRNILFEPARQYDELCIISGFATPSMAVHHMQEVETHLSKRLKVINIRCKSEEQWNGERYSSFLVLGFFHISVLVLFVR